jgi:glycerophosphodiester phosphodiesterase
MKILIESSGLRELDLNLPENGYGWTPLIVACVQGNQSVVKILLDAGADQSLCDAFSWTARDHTAFRGFWPIRHYQKVPLKFLRSSFLRRMLYLFVTRTRPESLSILAL